VDTERRSADGAVETAAPGRRTRRAPGPDERRRDPERTKARILEAAVEEFSAKGFAGARVSGIAARAGVNQQLIAYYFDGKEGLYREIGRQWRAHEAQEMPGDIDTGELMRRYVRASVDPRLGGRLLAWDGLADTGDDEDDEEARERNVRLQQEVEQIRERQRAGELDDRLDPAVLALVLLSAGNALAVYPQLARGLLGADGRSPELVERYADQLTEIIARLAPAPDSP
jgi:TetR/AcrR family transcriptional regulator